MEKKIRTMEALAREIGISRPTLSRYFQDPNLVRNSTRIRIGEALQNIDYVPNFFARNMNRNETRLLGVIVPDLSDLFYATLIQHIEAICHKEGYTLVIHSTAGRPGSETIAIRNLRAMNADAAIVAPTGIDHDATHYRRIADDLKLVFVDSMPRNLGGAFPFIGNDNRQSIGVLVEYLCRSGSYPVFIPMPPVNHNAKNRLDEYLRKMQSLGHDGQILTLAEPYSDWDFESHGYNVVRHYFDRGLSADSTILCANDRIAIGALRAAHEIGYEIGPDGLRIAGHDDHPMCPFVFPALTSATQDVGEIARRSFLAATNLEIYTSGKADLLSARLVLRNSA